MTRLPAAKKVLCQPSIYIIILTSNSATPMQLQTVQYSEEGGGAPVNEIQLHPYPPKNNHNIRQMRC